MSDNNNIIDMKKRTGETVYPEVVAKSILTKDNIDLATKIERIYNMMNRLYIVQGSGDRVSSGFPSDKLDKNKVMVDGEEREIVTSKDYAGNITYSRTVAEAVIMPDGTSLDEKLDMIMRDVTNLDNLLNPFKIVSFTTNKETNKTYPIGFSLNELVFAWHYNKNARSQHLNLESLGLGRREVPLDAYTFRPEDMELDEDLRTKYYTYNYTLKQPISPKNQATYALNLDVIGNDGRALTGKTQINFLNYIYYGAHTSTEFAMDIINFLDKRFASTKNATVRVNCGKTKYAYLCIPTRFGKPTMQVGILGPGGFNDLGTIDITNECGYTEQYQIFRSVNRGLGVIDIKIS